MPTSKKCPSGYIRNRSTKRCVFKYGRPSPTTPASQYHVGSKRLGKNKRM